ncbi:MAG: nitrous oxide-stimulated promoter family protein [Candidatus Bathyarchaeota archaeon]|jgi:hypothetical protein|nr:nitrous oxide-stimulated promoter family protein [Candidatus Bathyarchaeota archaeon]
MQEKREKELADHPRIVREKKTIEAMIKIYCNHHHNTSKELCTECKQLFEYAKKKLNKCPFQENKTTCGKCPIHCYEPSKRQEAKKVMRYAGPRMIWYHPKMAIQHLLDGRKKPKKLSGKRK